MNNQVVRLRALKSDIKTLELKLNDFMDMDLSIVANRADMREILLQIQLLEVKLVSLLAE